MACQLSRRAFLQSAGLAALGVAVPLRATPGSRQPNLILIYADDLGYGDVGCYGATRVATPNIDRLAREGVRFTNAHSASATCTPSRYALLTGEYAWRRRGTGVLPGDARLIVEPGRTTLASLLQRVGYKTAAIGKWHLGLGAGDLDWNGDIRPGPLDIGFDHCFLIPATGDRVPCVYVEDRRVAGLDPSNPIRVSYREPVGDEPTGRDHPELLKMHPSHGHDQTIVNGISRIGYMAGGKSARWVDEDMADTITARAVRFIEQNQAGPFFLYFSTHDIHVPRVPHPRFAGVSGLGPRGDVILQLDWCVGEVLKALDRLNLADNTMVIFTSDNGPVVDDGYQDQAVELLDGHRPTGDLRGGKYSAFDAGTRVPFIVRHPGRIKPGASGALLCQIDLLASMATLTGQTLGGSDAPDSFDVSAALLGRSQTGRDHLIEHAGTLSLIQGDWKYIEPSKGARFNKSTNTELGNDPEPQLYNLRDDLGEKANLADRHPEKAKEMAALLQEIRQRGRSRP
ncbi:MAG: arylsulfatase [Phycisphaerales bacterium]